MPSLENWDGGLEVSIHVHVKSQILMLLTLTNHPNTIHTLAVDDQL